MSAGSVIRIFCSGFVIAASLGAQAQYDLLIKGGHVIDPANNIDRVADIGIKAGAIARVASDIPANQSKQVIQATGLYVTPGLVDIHAHVFAGGETVGSAFAGGSFSISPDGMSFRHGVTTVVDAGSSGWRSFPEFKRRIIERDTNYPKARVLAMLNIVGHGMGGAVEQNTEDMDAEATARVARENPKLIVGVKVAHYAAPDWIAVDRAVAAGKLANIPVMVDFGRSTPERSYQDLVLKHLRPGDVSTHMYASSIPLFDETGKLLPYLAEARQRGVKFDLGHGNKSFFWNQAAAAVEQGWIPDAISTDIHVRSQLTSLKDMTTAMSKMLVLGIPLNRVIRMSTLTPALLIKRPELGRLTVGAPADVALLRLVKGEFGYLDGDDLRYSASEKLICEMTVSGGAVVWDLHGLSGRPWSPRKR